jgi:hypothetical protein
MNKKYLGLTLGVIALVVAGLGVAKLVKAYAGSARIVIENVQNYNEAASSDQALGATSYDQTNLAALIVSGATSLNTLTVTGAVSGISSSSLTNLSVVNTVSSSVVVGSASKSGCLEVGNIAGNALAYITTDGSTVSVSTTKPAICK